MKKILPAGIIIIWLAAAGIFAQEAGSPIRVEGDTIYAPVNGV